jgi:ubiquinone biosynthesis protein
MRIGRRYLTRYRQIAEILVRHGFGALVAQLGLDQALDLRRRLGREPEQPVSRKTAAIHLREALQDLGPTFIKVGQIASTRPEFLPPEFVDELANLQDNVPPAPWDRIQGIIEAELGTSIAELFLAIDPTPIASASLGQVYAGLLRDRTEIVVKVQRPDIERVIETDLAILQDLARLAQERLPRAELHDPVGIAAEFSEALRGELDYRREGRNADRFRENFAKEDGLYVPKVYWEYTTRRVMVQERLHGIKISDYDALMAAGYDRYKVADNAARMIIKEVLEDGYFHADPHPGNLLILPGEVIGLIDFGTVGYLDSGDRGNLVRLYVDLIQFDAEGVVDQLIRMGIADPGVDQLGLIRALRRLLRKYYGLPLKEISASDLLTEIQPVIYEFQLHVPSDYWLLIKTLVIMEGVGKSLAPDFDVFAVSGPYVRRFLIRMALPTTWAPAIARGAGGWINLLTLFPRQTTKIMGQLERGDLTLKVRQPAVQQQTKEINQAANRIVLAMLIGALAIALAMLLPSLDLQDWPWGIVTWLILMGFLVVMFLMLWLIFSLWRSNRRP